MNLGSGIEVIISAAVGNFIAQFYKFISFIITNKKLNLARLFQTGGMPSSHTAFMVAMTTSCGLISGFNSVDFAIALVITFVVMYDAAGLRRSVGKQAAVINQIISELFSQHPHLSSERFKELLGHTPIEVFVGAILGINIALIVHWIC